MDKLKCQRKDALKTEEEKERESWWGWKSREHKPLGLRMLMEWGMEVLPELRGNGKSQREVQREGHLLQKNGQSQLS